LRPAAALPRWPFRRSATRRLCRGVRGGDRDAHAKRMRPMLTHWLAKALPEQAGLREATLARPANLFAAIVLIAAAATMLFVIITVPSSAAPAYPSSACGVERWSVKTLTDGAARSINFGPRTSTVDALRSLRAPAIGRASPRQRGPERTVYRVRGRLVEMKLEDDRDVHLVIASPTSGKTMIAELPSSTCTHGATATARSQMSRARQSLYRACGRPSTSWHKLSGTAMIDGVGFFDVKHGQTGVAPNGIELHPVLRFVAHGC
jgi:hypothetical protein